MADRSGKPRYKSLKNEAGEDRLSNSNMAISEAETSTAPVLLKENEILEGSLAGRKPELGKANLLFWQRMIVKAQLVLKRYVF